MYWVGVASLQFAGMLQAEQPCVKSAVRRASVSRRVAYITKNLSPRQPTLSYYEPISRPACLTRTYTYCVGQRRGSKIS
jgi:hypothetical protein